jgi:hypothetical protein
MTHPNTLRFDIYTTIHKALRALMSDVMIQVGQVDSEDGFQILDAGSKVRTLLEVCREHLFLENHFIHPAMDARLPGSACAASSDHVRQEEELEALEARLLTVERSFGPARSSALLDLYRALALFVAENIEHMQLEELENNAALWSAYSDEELKHIHEELLAAVAPERMAFYQRWLLPNISHPERVAVLSGMQYSMSDGAFAHLLSVLKDNIDERDWLKIRDGFAPSPTFQPA